MSKTYETRGVLASAYTGKRANLRALLTHTLEKVDGARVLCGRVRLDSLADAMAGDTEAPPTCPRCLAKDPRFPKASPAGAKVNPKKT